MPGHPDPPPSGQGDARDVPAPADSEPRARPGRAVVWAAALVLLEAVVLLVWAAVLGVLAVTADVTSRPLTAGLAGTALLVGMLLGSGARALSRGHRAARGPLLTWHLLQAATATAFLTVGPVAAVVSGLAIVVGAAVIVLLLVGPRPDRGPRQPPAPRPAPP